MEGKIVKCTGGLFTIYSDNQFFNASARGKLKSNGLYIGDNVVFETEQISKNTYVITDVLERKNLLIRPVISNVDNAIIVIAKVPAIDYYLIDKIIINSFQNDIIPYICINKTDLNSDEEINNVKSEYTGIVKEIIPTSTVENNGIGRLAEILKPKSLNIFAGQSAVGKSSILNKLIGKDTIKVGELSTKIERGKQTTRHSEIFLFENGAMAADTPGFSLLDLDKVLKPEEIKLYYADFQEYSQKCRFRTCTHTNEDGCEVLKAVQNGLINKNRYERYKKIYFDQKEKWQNRWQ